MANYNTFVVVDCNSRKSILTTSSARKAVRMLDTGYRVDIWNSNEKIGSVYQKTRAQMDPYIQAEKEYIREKQARAEARNRAKKQRKKRGEIERQIKKI